MHGAITSSIRSCRLGWGFRQTHRLVLYLEVRSLIQCIWLTKSPTYAKPQNVNFYVFKKIQKNRNLKNKLRIVTKLVNKIYICIKRFGSSCEKNIERILGKARRL